MAHVGVRCDHRDSIGDQRLHCALCRDSRKWDSVPRKKKNTKNNEVPYSPLQNACLEFPHKLLGSAPTDCAQQPQHSPKSWATGLPSNVCNLERLEWLIFISGE